MKNKTSFDSKEFKKSLTLHSTAYTVFHLPSLEKKGLGSVTRLPYSIRVLLESSVRNFDGYQVTETDVTRLLGWSKETAGKDEIAFKPGRVVLQDFTGVPTIVDLAAMRDAMKRFGGDYRKINPQVMCDLVVDHSIQVDSFGSKKALKENVAHEFARNRERYEFLKWGQKAFQNFRVVPPATGIVHQVNLEYLATGVLSRRVKTETHLYPDSLVGTDSHTTMINGLGVVAWGVGGIEAEAVMLGEPIYMVMPEVTGFKFTGRLREGVTATDLVLCVTEILRKKGVVGKFVEFYGEGMRHLSLPDRATVANMAPEYGATMGYFPVDEETLNYYRLSGRKPKDVEIIERYMKEQGLFASKDAPVPDYTETLELDLSKVVPSLAGPKRPQDRLDLADMKIKFNESLTLPVDKKGFGLSREDADKKVTISGKSKAVIGHGAVVIAAITSCTNTSNPSVMLAAGILAKKAYELGLKTPAYVKTSLAPGSTVVTEYLKKSGLLPYLEKLGFHVVGYGCTTCIGNSGPLPELVGKAVKDSKLVAAAVLSGNRNFEGRVNPLCKANYLASPPLVVAFALAGRVDIDLTREPIGLGKGGRKIYLKDVWPTNKEIQAFIKKSVTASAFVSRYANVFKGNLSWNKVHTHESELYRWQDKSTYIQEPPYFLGIAKEAGDITPIRKGRVLAVLGDSVTTDHISPAGSISVESPAGRFLIEHKVSPKDFNSYGARRGNDRVMTRGTFANIRLRNLLVPSMEGPWTLHMPSREQMSIFDASVKYHTEGVPLVILAGKEYGSGSSRDWAAKGPALLGVRVVIAESYERIHRSNLVGMGVLPLEYASGQTRETLGLAGDEVFDVEGLDNKLKAGQSITVKAVKPDGRVISFVTKARIDTPVEVDYYRNGGILPTVLRKLLKN